jgi:hypothetical protein
MRAAILFCAAFFLGFAAGVVFCGWRLIEANV